MFAWLTRPQSSARGVILRHAPNLLRLCGSWTRRSGSKRSKSFDRERNFDCRTRPVGRESSDKIVERGLLSCGPIVVCDSGSVGMDLARVEWTRDSGLEAGSCSCGYGARKRRSLLRKEFIFTSGETRSLAGGLGRFTCSSLWVQKTRQAKRSLFSNKYASSSRYGCSRDKAKSIRDGSGRQSIFSIGGGQSRLHGPVAHRNELGR